MSQIFFTAIFIIFLLLFFPGPVHAVDEKYIWEKRVVKNISLEADDLKKELAKEVQKIIDAGHLETAYFVAGISPGLQFWGYPGEQIYILSNALPYLSTNLQTEVKAFLKEENQNHPPEEVGFMHRNDTGWGLDNLDGNRREFYPMDSGISVNIWPPVEVPLEGLFMLWEYADKTGDWSYINTNWNQLVNLYDNKSSNIDSYGEIAGLIGMVRMAEKTGDFGIRDDAVLKTNIAFDNSDYLQFVENAQARFPDMQHDWDYPVFCSVRQENAVGCFFTSEIGRYLYNHELTQIHQSVDFYIGNGAGGFPDSLFPGWFIHRGDYNYHEWRLGNHRNYNSRGEYLGGENSFRTPDISWIFFMIRAYVYGDDGFILKRFLDIPTCVGDLYHIQKLIAVIESFGQVCFEDIRTGSQTCEPELSCAGPGDVNCDEKVNSEDAKLVLTHWLETNVLGKDPWPDGIINSLDFGWVVKDWN